MPVSVPTPLDVHIVDGPGWFGAISLIVGVIALVVAVITLLRVNRQVELANKQLKLADDQLKVANKQLGQGAKEIALVSDDLEIQREQINELRRRPKLNVRLNCSMPDRTFEVLCENVGERSTLEFRVRLYIPWEYASNIRGPRVDIGQQIYKLVEIKSARDRLYPGNLVAVSTIWQNEELPFSVYWNADDEFGHYPPQGVGAIDVAASGSSQPGIAPDDVARFLWPTS